MFKTRRALIPVAAALACFAIVAHADPVFTALLDGEQILPEPVKTEATGKAEMTVAADGKSIAYKITVEKLVNPASADVHLGPPTQNGPPVARLFPHGASGAKKGVFSGVLVEGTFGPSDLVGPLTGSPLADFIDELKAGNVYVNVHTNDGMDPPNSGPGDFRLGEIRGQFK